MQVKVFFFYLLNKDFREALVLAWVDEIISDDEFMLLYNVFRPKTCEPKKKYEIYPFLRLDDWD